MHNVLYNLATSENVLANDLLVEILGSDDASDLQDQIKRGEYTKKAIRDGQSTGDKTTPSPRSASDVESPDSVSSYQLHTSQHIDDFSLPFLDQKDLSRRLGYRRPPMS